MSKRAEHRARYIEGWDSMDAGKLLASIADGFIFDDPADPRPVNKATLVAYMAVWPRRAALLGGAVRIRHGRPGGAGPRRRAVRMADLPQNALAAARVKRDGKTYPNRPSQTPQQAIANPAKTPANMSLCQPFMMVALPGSDAQ